MFQKGMTLMPDIITIIPITSLYLTRNEAMIGAEDHKIYPRKVHQDLCKSYTYVSASIHMKTYVVLYIHAAEQPVYHNVCEDSSKSMYCAHWACAPQAARPTTRENPHGTTSAVLTHGNVNTYDGLHCLTQAHCCSICASRINNKLIGLAIICSSNSTFRHGDKSYQCCLASSRPPRLGDPAMGL